MATSAAKLQEPDVSDSSFLFQQRNYQLEPFHFNDVVKGRKENPLAASRWREMLIKVAVQNLMGVVINNAEAANGITVLPLHLRESNQIAADRQIGALPPNASDEEWTAYYDKLDKATKAATAISKDNENMAKREAMAGQLLHGWVLKTLTKSGMQW